MENQKPQEQIDPTALALKRAIFQQEGNDYSNTSGDNGTSAGAGQWNNGKLPLKKGEIPANFKSAATQFGLDPNDFSETNQDHVGYLQVKHDLDSGLTQSQVAAKWNSGLTNGWEDHKGSTIINGKTVSYDTPAYVANVQKYYQEEVSGEPLSANNSTPSPSSNSSDTGFITKADIPQPTDQPNQNKGLLGTNSKDSLYGKIIDNSLTRGVENVGNFLTFGGTKQLGNQVGTSLAAIPAATKDLVTGSNNSQYHDQPSLGQTAAGTAKTVGGTLLQGGGGLLEDAIRGDTILGRTLSKAPVITKALSTYVPEIKEGQSLDEVMNTGKLSASQTYDALSNALKNASATEAKVLQQGLDKVEPLAIKEAGGIVKFSELHPGWTKAGNVVGGLIKKLGSAAVSAGIGATGAEIYNHLTK